MMVMIVVELVKRRKNDDTGKIIAILNII